MNIDERISHLSATGSRLALENLNNNPNYSAANAMNPWFSVEFIMKSVSAICEQYLHRQKLEEWIANYELSAIDSKRTIGIVMAGNVPLVGLHDFICVYIAGFHIQLKLSAKDKVLMTYFLQTLEQFDTRIFEQVKLVEQLQQIDAVIATGSSNTHRYFEYYFKNIPSILRKNRNSVAILNGDESDAQLQRLSDDIFMFFGLGCRNVSKIYVPANYDLTKLFPYFEKYQYFFQHAKYMNNYDYNRTLLLMNGTDHLANDFCIIRESSDFSSRIAELHYEKYVSIGDVIIQIEAHQEELQCVLSEVPIPHVKVLPFGKAQQPGLHDYADNVDTMAFLISV